MQLNVKHADGTTTINISEEEARARFPANEVDAAVSEAQAEQARLQAEQQISAVYPLPRQLEVMASGTAAERREMADFIKRVRAGKAGEAVAVPE